jgi:putative phage head-tail adaptor|nr:MAG TPA: Putative head tail adaptor [Caudoviricetes sp.]
MIYDAGTLNKKINIVGRVTKEVNGFDKTVNEIKYKNISASIKPSRGREYYEAKQVSNAENVLITIRYRDNIYQSDIVEYGKHTYEIQSVVNPEMQNESLELYCVEKIRGKQEENPKPKPKNSGGWEG